MIFGILIHTLFRVRTHSNALLSCHTHSRPESCPKPGKVVFNTLERTMDTVPQNFSPPAYNSGYGYDNSQYSDPDDTGTTRGFSVGSITNPIKDALKPITKPINNVLVSIDPTNKNSNLRALFRDVDKLVLTPVAGILESIWLSPYLAAYLQSLELQINDGRAKHLPPWLKHLIYTRYPNVQIDKVRYGENIKMATIQPGTAMTIGYNVYFPGSINLDPAKIITTNAGGWDLARDVHWILHELEHTAQFISSGTDKSTWAIKYLGASVLHANVNPSAAHDAIPLERQADAKADALLNIVLTGYTRQHPTYILPLSAHGSDKSTIQLDIFINNTTVPGFINGTSIHSPNEQYRCIVQGDGNLVVYGPSNRIIWQSNTTARANPPFALGCSDDKTHMTLLGSPLQTTLRGD